MYLLSQEVTLEWELSPTETPPGLGDLDLVIIDPNGAQQYVQAPILSENYTAPTDTLPGNVTYLFTPNLEGFWRIRLVTGTSTDYQILSKMEMFVFDNTEVTSPFSDDIGRPTPYDINYYLQGFVVPGEIYGSFVASRSISLAEDVPGSVAICETSGDFFNTEFDIMHNGSVVGSVVFTPGSLVGTVTCNSLLMVAGDKLQIRVSNTTDDAISDIAINIVGCCTVVPCTVF